MSRTFPRATSGSECSSVFSSGGSTSAWSSSAGIDPELFIAALRSDDGLRELAAGVALRDGGQRLRRDARGLAFAAELQIPLPADALRGLARRLEVVARVELVRVLREVLADRARHREPDVGVDVDLAHAVLDRFLDLLDRHAVRLLHLAAVLPDLLEQVLRHARRAVHHE